MSNIVGPIEKMTLANHPVNGLYFTMTGGPEVCMHVFVSSYLSWPKENLTTSQQHGDFIDTQKLW